MRRVDTQAQRPRPHRCPAGMVAAIAAVALIALSSSVVEARSSWPPPQWQSAANRVTMTVLAPKSTQGLHVRSVDAEHCAPHEAVSAAYQGGVGAYLQIHEGRGFYACANIGIEKLVKHVTIAGHRANLLACGVPHCPPGPDALIWMADHDEVQVTWMGISTSKALALARSFAVVPRANGKTAQQPWANATALARGLAIVPRTSASGAQLSGGARSASALFERGNSHQGECDCRRRGARSREH